MKWSQCQKNKNLTIKLVLKFKNKNKNRNSYKHFLDLSSLFNFSVADENQDKYSWCKL